jgi:hypothetical protein
MREVNASAGMEKPSAAISASTKTACCILLPHISMTSLQSGISGGITASALSEGKLVLGGTGPMRQKNLHLGSSSGGHGDKGLLLGPREPMRVQ